jgi:leader peptidase (prepilin peptidase)/N-methyltransferase
MHGVVVALCALFGLLVGSFLNVVIARVPDGRSVVHPPSACPCCGHVLSAWENVPVLSWLVLRAKCRSCHLPISAIYPAVELLTAVVFALVGWRVGWHAPLPAALWFAAASIALSAIDLATRRLPNTIVFPTQEFVVGVLAIGAIVTGEPRRLRDVLLGAALASGFLWLLRRIVPRGMGMGDVKYAVAIGGLLGWYGLGRVALGIFAGFLLGSIVGVTQAAMTGKLRKATMPFGPALAAGEQRQQRAGGPILHWYRGLS